MDDFIRNHKEKVRSHRERHREQVRKTGRLGDSAPDSDSNIESGEIAAGMGLTKNS